MLGTLRRLTDLEWPIRLMSPWIGLYNPLAPGFSQNPYPFLDRLRSEAPVYYSRMLGSFVFSTFEDVEAILSDHRFTSDRSKDESWRNQLTYKLMKLSEQEANAFDTSLTSAPPDVHRRLRGLIRDVFARSSIATLRPRIQRWVDHLLDEASKHGEMDVVRDFASPLPILVMSEILGLPSEDREKLEAWSDCFIILVDPMVRGGSMQKMKTAYFAMDDYLWEKLQQKERNPGDDLMSHLLQAKQRGELSEVELRTLTLMLLTAGHEVMTNLITNSIAMLLENPGERERLQDDPGMMNSAIEEFLRFQSPIQAAWRISTEEMEIRGQRIPRNRAVTCLIGAANRDPSRFRDPHRLDLGRQDNRHIAFGYGSHFCVGPWLARLEGEIALSSLLDRFPNFRGDAAKIRWKPAMGLRGVYGLPISL